MKIAKNLAILVAIVYCVFAFISWEFNPANWSGLVRLGFIVLIVLWPVTLFFSKIINKVMDKIKADIAEEKAIEAEANRNAGGFRSVLQGQFDKAEQARKAAQ